MHTWFITPRLVAFLARFVCACTVRGRHNQMFQNSGNVATLSWPDSSVTILWVGGQRRNAAAPYPRAGSARYNNEFVQILALAASKLGCVLRD